MNAWVCNRCRSFTDDGFVDEPPEGWRFIDRQARGVTGVKSLCKAVICEACDDSLYEWWNQT